MNMHHMIVCIDWLIDWLRQLIWISPQTNKGFRLPIPSIVVHAVSAGGAGEDFPEPCLYLMVDYEKAGKKSSQKFFDWQILGIDEGGIVFICELYIG